MEPNLNVPQRGMEQGPALPPVSPEYGERVSSPETTVEQRPEIQHEQPAAIEQQGSIAAPASGTATVPDPATQASTSDDTTSISTDDLVAEDTNLIEKQWIDKSKAIIRDTKDDPYRREEAVSELQREYLRKRYGKEIGTTDE